MGFFKWLFETDSSNTPIEKPKELPMYTEETFVIKDMTTAEPSEGYVCFYFMSDKGKGYQLSLNDFIQNIFTWKNAKIGDTICVKHYIRGSNYDRYLFEIVE